MAAIWELLEASVHHEDRPRPSNDAELGEEEYHQGGPQMPGIKAFCLRQALTDCKPMMQACLQLDRTRLAREAGCACREAVCRWPSPPEEVV